MAEERKKKRQIALLIGGAVIVGAIGYYYYSTKKSDETESSDITDIQQNGHTKIEQITYAGDDSNIKQKYESKSEELSDVIDESTDDMIKVEEKEESPVIVNKAEEEEPIAVVIKQEEEEENRQEQKEEEPIAVVISEDDEEEEREEEEEEEEENKQEQKEENKQEEKEEEIEIKTLIQKYDNIADVVSTYKTLKYKNGKLTVKIINVTNIDKTDDEKNDALVKLNLPEQKEEQSNIKQNNSDNIEFNDQFTLNVNDTVKDVLIVTIENNEKEIGKVEINVIDIVASKDQCIENREFEVIGSKCGCKVYLNLIYFEEI